MHRALRRRLLLVALTVLATTTVTPLVAAASGGTTDDPDPAESLPAGYVRLVDDTGFLTVVVPEAWTLVDTASRVNPDQSAQPLIFASTTDIDGFNETWTSGVLYIAVPFEADAEAVVADSGLSSGCGTIDVRPYDDPIFSGYAQVGTNCGDHGGRWTMIVASPADGSFTAIVQVQISSDDEREAFDAVLATFTYAGDPTVAPGALAPATEPDPTTAG